ncbi:MAG: phenylalanine--tRNA ligase subunit beta [Clostridiales bacterium]|jgi:phenylalanyl-tRNA synthetase beta chain|nr:phenylalanine--tRNA ligase subunit beta [Clostridiales bacterium]
MKLPLNWLKEYVDVGTTTPEGLADKLLNAGFEVEEIRRLDRGMRGIVAGRIQKISRHENAARLQVCQTDIGRGEPVVICTAATNVFEGATVPVATDGSVLADGTNIRATDMRGVLSRGMLCSGYELGIDNSVYEGAETDGIMILTEDYAPGTDMLDILGLNDVVLDVSVTANRPDCQCVYGMAREAAALLNKPIKPLETDFAVAEGGANAEVAVTVENKTLCPRYMAQAARGIRVAPSPAYMRHRLHACGVRPINNIVDITNYVLLEVGQPLHAFDTALLADRKIVVRNANGGERITALDGKEYALKESMLVIADGAKPVAIAGVMGGEYSGINEKTAEIVIESARFDRGSVRATSRALGLRSDASARYEKGVDQSSPETGLARALNLICGLGCGAVLPRSADIGGAPAKKTVSFPVKEIAAVLGVPAPAGVVSDVLNRLSLPHKIADGVLKAEIPPYRGDLNDGADIAEEVIRVWGYDKLKPVFMKKARPTAGGKPKAMRCADKAKTLLAGLGALEISTYSFIPPASNAKLLLKPGDALYSRVRIQNPLGEEFSVMRANLAHGVLTAAEYNLKHRNDAFRLFEYGRIYREKTGARSGTDKEPPYRETDTIAVAATGGADEDFFTLKGLVEEIGAEFRAEFGYMRSSLPFLHPGKSADISLGGEPIGYLGEVHPAAAKNYGLAQSVLIAELDFGALATAYDGRVTARELPKFPAVERDLALVMDAGTEVGVLIDALYGASPLIGEIKLFDVYRGPQVADGMKSAAIRITLQDYAATLTDERINAVMADVLKAAERGFKATLRV